MTAEFQANDLAGAADMRSGSGWSHKLHSHGKPRAADCSGRPAGRAGGRAGRRHGGGRGGRATRRARRAAWSAAELGPADPGLLPAQGLGTAALHRGLRHGPQRVDVHRGAARAALAGAHAAAELGRVLPDIRDSLQGQPRHQQLHRVPGYRSFHIRFYRAVDRGRIDGDPVEYHADPRAAFPAGLPAAGLRDGGVPATAAVDDRDVRHRAGHWGTAHLVLAAADPGAADAGHVQHGRRADHGQGGARRTSAS